jgi:hypothetical protein
LPGWLSGLIQHFSERQQPMPVAMAQKRLRALDRLADMGDRRAAAVQLSEVMWVRAEMIAAMDNPRTS